MYFHHSLAKNATDKALHNWKHRAWPNNIISEDVYQTLAAQTFPAPDALLFDPTRNHSIAIEFKPPTETKRGILTGIGQALAYIKNSSLAYLVAPKIIEGLDFSLYLRDLFMSTIHSKMPIGLICYRDEEAKDLELLIDIEASMQLGAAPPTQERVGRYWAKHIDLPLQGIWLILDIAYQMPNVDNRIEAIYRKLWDDYLFPLSHRNTLDIIPTEILKHDGTPLYILAKEKKKLKADVDAGLLSLQDAIANLNRKIDPSAPGDNYYKSIKKNYFPLIKHLMLWDDSGNLTEDGLMLHRIGKIHGPNSETFKNYFGRVLLFNGNHLELILDVENITRNKPLHSADNAVRKVQDIYIQNGLYRPVPGAVTTGTVPFLKYERIIWGHLGFLNKVSRSQFVPNRGFAFNWDKITELCSLEN